jgi:hypothetical protein
MKFLNLTTEIALGIIGIVVAVSMLAGLWSTFGTALTTLNNTAAFGTDAVAHPLPLRALIDPSGVVPLVLIAVFVIAIIVGLFAMIKSSGKKR